MEFLELDGAKLEYRLWPGSGETGLVLLHEGLGSVSMWRDFPERLRAASGSGVFAWSRRGYGGSSPAPQPWPVGYMHEEARRFLPLVLQATGFEKFVLIGHSDGASIAAIYAGEHPKHGDFGSVLPLVPAQAGIQKSRRSPTGFPPARERAGGLRQSDLINLSPAQSPHLRGLVLMAPHFFVEDVSIASIAQARLAYETGELRRGLERHHGGNVDGAFWGWNRIWLDPAFRDWDIQAHLSAIAVPTLLIQGADDEYGTLAQLEAAQSAIEAPTSSVILSACRHSPHRDQTEATVQAILAFLAGL